MEKEFDDAVEYLKILLLFCRVVGLALLSPIWILPYLVYKKRVRNTQPPLPRLVVEQAEMDLPQKPE